MQFGERVAVQSGDDILLFEIQRPEHNLENDEDDLEAVSEEPQQRPVPAGASFVAYRWGDCRMEVDFPADHKSVYARCMIAFTLGWNCVLVPFAGIVIGLWRVLFLPIFFIAGGIVWMYVTLQETCTHENLTLTPTGFNIRSTIEFRPKYRDSVNNADKAEAKLSVLDILFRRQSSGKTDDLTGAEIKERSNGDYGRYKYFALMEGRKEHKLYHHLSAAEREWLVSEINEVLQNIRQRTGNPSGNV